MGRPGRARSFATSRWMLAAVIGAIVGASCFSTTSGALPTTSSPVLTLARTIRTTPYLGTSSSMRDGEGSAYVPNAGAHPNLGGTDSLWLAEDNGRSVWEIDPVTGVLKSSIHDATWQATRQYNAGTNSGTGPTAGPNRGVISRELGVVSSVVEQPFSGFAEAIRTIKLAANLNGISSDNKHVENPHVCARRHGAGQGRIAQVAVNQEHASTDSRDANRQSGCNRGLAFIRKRGGYSDDLVV